jgi:prephenate dehydratase
MGANDMTGLKGGVIPEDTRDYWEVEDLTSIEFTLSDKPGVLMKALDVFRENNMNLTRIQSKPNKTTKGKKVMKFDADFIAKSNDPAI